MPLRVSCVAANLNCSRENADRLEISPRKARRLDHPVAAFVLASFFFGVSSGFDVAVFDEGLALCGRRPFTSLARPSASFARYG